MKEEKYKGYDLAFRRDVWGFLAVRITRHKNKDTRRQEYVLREFSTFEKTKKAALVYAKKYIDDFHGTDRLKFRSSGLSKAKYLPK